MPIANRAFGIELEVQMPRSLTKDALAAAIRAAGVSCYAESYGHSEPRNWKIVHDGSIEGGNGAEVVSPKLIGEAGLADAVTVAKAIQAAGCKVDKSCGFHCHVDANDFDAKQLANVAINYLWFETFFDHIMPASRRGSEGYYVQSNRAHFAGYGATPAQRYGTEALNAGIAAINAAKARNSTGAIVTAVCGHARYFKLNMQAHNRQGTVEFRQHSGTVEFAKVENWVRLLVAFVDKCKTSRPRPRTVAREWTAAQEMHLFFSMFDVGAETAAYYVERRKTIAKQDKAMVVAQAAAQVAAERQRAALRANIAPFAARVTEALQARLTRLQESSRYQYRALARIRNAIAQVASFVATGAADLLLNACREWVRRRILPVAVLRSA